MKSKIPVLLLMITMLSSCSQRDSMKEHTIRQNEMIIKEDIPADFIPRDITVVAAGDSLTKGIGDSTAKGGYIPYLEQLLEKEKGIGNVSFHNFGVSGIRSDQLLSRLQTGQLSQTVQTADLIILTVGGNDVMKVVKENLTELKISKFQEQEKTFHLNLTQMLKAIREKNDSARIVLIGLYNPFNSWFSNVKEMNEILNTWNEGSQKVLSKFSNTHFVEVDELFSSSTEELLFSDYFHPNNKGYFLIADTVFKKLSDSLVANREDRAVSTVEKGTKHD